MEESTDNSHKWKKKSKIIKKGRKNSNIGKFFENVNEEMHFK